MCKTRGLHSRHPHPAWSLPSSRPIQPMPFAATCPCGWQWAPSAQQVTNPVLEIHLYNLAVSGNSTFPFHSFPWAKSLGIFFDSSRPLARLSLPFSLPPPPITMSIIICSTFKTYRQFDPVSTCPAHLWEHSSLLPVLPLPSRPPGIHSPHSSQSDLVRIQVGSCTPLPRTQQGSQLAQGQSRVLPGAALGGRRWGSFSDLSAPILLAGLLAPPHHTLTPCVFPPQGLCTYCSFSPMPTFSRFCHSLFYFRSHPMSPAPRGFPLLPSPHPVPTPVLSLLCCSSAVTPT